MSTLMRCCKRVDIYVLLTSICEVSPFFLQAFDWREGMTGVSVQKFGEESRDRFGHTVAKTMESIAHCSFESAVQIEEELILIQQGRFGGAVVRWMLG